MSKSPLVASLDAFIGEDPVDIAIQRAARVSDDAGGTLVDTRSTLDRQRVRLVRESSTPTRSLSGTDNQVELDKYVVVGHDSLDIAEDDVFDAKGKHWRVMTVWDGPYRSRRAEVIQIDVS